MSTLCAFQCYNLIIFERMNKKIYAKLCSAVPNIHTVSMGSVILLPLNKFKGFLIGIYTISSHWYCDTFPNCYSQTKLSDNPMSFQSKISTPFWILFSQVNCSFLLANIQETRHGQEILGNIWLSFREKFIMGCRAFSKQGDNAIGSVCASIHQKKKKSCISESLPPWSSPY